VHVYWMFCAECAYVLDLLCGLCVCVGCFVRIVTCEKAKCARVYWMPCADWIVQNTPLHDRSRGCSASFRQFMAFCSREYW